MLENKYKRMIRSCVEDKSTITVDVYSILVAFNVTCPARQHAIKKLLCAGDRGKGGTLQDLEESIQAIQRAIEIEKCRLSEVITETPKTPFTPTPCNSEDD